MRTHGGALSRSTGLKGLLADANAASDRAFEILGAPSGPPIKSAQGDLLHAALEYAEIVFTGLSVVSSESGDWKALSDFLRRYHTGAYRAPSWPFLETANIGECRELDLNGRIIDSIRAIRGSRLPDIRSTEMNLRIVLGLLEQMPDLKRGEESYEIIVQALRLRLARMRVIAATVADHASGPRSP